MEEELIECVRQHPAIWQISLRSYRDSRVKENAWKEVAGYLDRYICWTGHKKMEVSQRSLCERAKEDKTPCLWWQRTTSYFLVEILWYLDVPCWHREARTNGLRQTFLVLHTERSRAVLLMRQMTDGMYQWRPSFITVGNKYIIRILHGIHSSIVMSCLVWMITIAVIEMDTLLTLNMA
jgi:hypothetical protein